MIVDGQPEPAGTFAAPPDCVVLYEVIRLTDGVFLFLDDHIGRLVNSAQLAGVELPVPADGIRKEVTRLPVINDVQTGNIRLEFYCRSGKVVRRAFYFIPHRYPPEEAYRTGVRTCLFRAKRTNPGAKIIHSDLARQVERLVAEKGVYEAIMVHPDGYVTEGSRSNFFAVKDNGVYTAPEADVLPGITRKYVLQICRELSIPLTEVRIPASQLSDYDAVFLSGTSPKVLPIAQIDGMHFPPDNPVVRRIMKRYDELAGLGADNSR